MIRAGAAPSEANGIAVELIAMNRQIDAEPLFKPVIRPGGNA